jgi:hypothetical protein
VVHALDVVFGVGALLSLAALVTIVLGIRGAAVGAAAPERREEDGDDVPDPLLGAVEC